MSVIRAAFTPPRINFCSLKRTLPAKMLMPTIPFRMIITAANTVSRAMVLPSSPLAYIMEMISAASMAVTERARIRLPKGCPNMCAKTSAC